MNLSHNAITGLKVTSDNGSEIDIEHDSLFVDYILLSLL